MPILISDYLDICDPVLTFDRFMEEMDLEKYLREIPKHDAGRPGYNPASMLKTVLFGFMILTLIAMLSKTRNFHYYLRRQLKDGEMERLALQISAGVDIPPSA